MNKTNSSPEKIFIIEATSPGISAFPKKVAMFFNKQQAEESLSFIRGLDLNMEFKIHQIWILE